MSCVINFAKQFKLARTKGFAHECPRFRKMFRDVTLWRGQERPGVIFPAKSLSLFLVLQQQREARASARNVTQCDITKRLT